jgi:Ulp1 family protease
VERHLSDVHSIMTKAQILDVNELITTQAGDDTSGVNTVTRGDFRMSQGVFQNEKLKTPTANYTMQGLYGPISNKESNFTISNEREASHNHILTINDSSINRDRTFTQTYDFS